MDFSTAESIYLAISFVVTIAALITLFRPPLTRLGLHDRAYIRALIEHELENRLSDMDISDMLNGFDKSDGYEDLKQEPFDR